MTKYVQVEGGTMPGQQYFPQPDTCDICRTPLGTCFVDGATISGPWGIMCLDCFKDHGKGLGPGKGQKYCKGE